MVDRPDASYLDSMTGQGVTVRQYHTFARQEGYTGEFGLGGFDAWARANPDKAASFNQMLVSAGGTPRQFANGGVILPFADHSFSSIFLDTLN